MKKKRIFIVIPFLFLLCATYSFAQQREVQPVQLKKISNRLYEVLGGQGARGGVYIGDKEVLLIDAKMDKKSVDRVIEEIKNITDNPIKYLVSTHSDADHIRGNQYFPDTVTFIAHENCRKELFHPDSNGYPSEWNNPELAPFMPSVTFREKMDMYIDSHKIELWYFGIGHTTGDIVIYFPEEKTAFIGDQIRLTGIPYIHSFKGGNSFENVKNLTRMLETLDVDSFYSGHDEMVGREEIIGQINLMKKRQEKVKELCAQEKTIEEIKNEFRENEARLVEIIYNEIMSSSK